MEGEDPSIEAIRAVQSQESSSGTKGQKQGRYQVGEDVSGLIVTIEPTGETLLP